MYYYWILINMADCLSSSIFSLWPKRNSSSKCTNHEYLSLYTPHRKFYRLPQRQIHISASARSYTHTHRFQCLKLCTLIQTSCIHSLTHPVQIWNHWALHLHSHSNAHSADTHTHWKLNRGMSYTYTCKQQTMSILPICKCEPFGFGVGIYCVVTCVFVSLLKLNRRVQLVALRQWDESMR